MVQQTLPSGAIGNLMWLLLKSYDCTFSLMRDQICVFDFWILIYLRIVDFPENFTSNFMTGLSSAPEPTAKGKATAVLLENNKSGDVLSQGLIFAD